MIEEAPGARHGRGDPRGGLRRGGEGGQGGRLCRRGHDRVHRRRLRGPARRPHLVHGDEHPAAGRASGDRGDHRPGPGRMAAPRRERASRCRKTQDELAINGWAMEARLYAEDPATASCPRPGRLDHFELADATSAIDTGVEEGDADHALLRSDDRQADRPSGATATRRSTGLLGVLERGRGLAGEDQRRLPRRAVPPTRISAPARSTPASSRARIDSAGPAGASPTTASGRWRRRRCCAADFGDGDASGDPWAELQGFRAQCRPTTCGWRSVIGGETADRSRSRDDADGRGRRDGWRQD